MNSLDHGKRYTYVKYKCRCKECTQANAEYKRNKAADYRSLQASKDRESLSADAQAFLDQLAHGLPSSYEWYGCRCDQCKAAKARVSNSYFVTKVLAN